MGRSEQVPVAYTVEQAAELTGLSVHQLRRWSRDLYAPRFGSGLYSFVDLVALRTLSQLRNERKVPPRELRKLGEWFAAHQEPEPWARVRFFTQGREVLWRDAKTGAWLSSRKPGQRADLVPVQVQRVESGIRKQARQLVKRTKDEIGHVTRDRGIAGGQYRIAGTRIPTAAIWELHEAGYSVDDIVREYPRLTARDVQVAIKEERRRRNAA